MSSVSPVAPSSGAQRALVGTFLRTFPDEVARRLETTPSEEVADLLGTQAPRDTARVIERLTPIWGARVLSLIAAAPVWEILQHIELTKLAGLLSQMKPQDRDRLLELLPPPGPRGTGCRAGAAHRRGRAERP